MKVLVPIDGSKNALKAVKHAGHMASLEADLEITLMYVITFEPKSLREASYIEKSSQNEANEILEIATQVIRDEASDAKVETVIKRGFNAADVILEYAELEKCDMIVMGTRGLSNVKRFLLGSVSSHVSQHSPCTVTLVK